MSDNLLIVLTAMLGGAIRVSTPFMFVALGECLTEKSGRVNLGHLFWLRSLAIIGQLTTIAVVQISFGAKLPA